MSLTLMVMEEQSYSKDNTVGTSMCINKVVMSSS